MRRGSPAFGRGAAQDFKRCGNRAAELTRADCPPPQFILYINPNTVRINRFILTVTYGYPYYKLIYGKDNFIYPKDKSLSAQNDKNARFAANNPSAREYAPREVLTATGGRYNIVQIFLSSRFLRNGC